MSISSRYWCHASAAVAAATRARIAMRVFLGDFKLVAAVIRRSAGAKVAGRLRSPAPLGLRRLRLRPSAPWRGIRVLGRARGELETGASVLLEHDVCMQRTTRAHAPELVEQVGLAGLQHLQELLARDVARQDPARAARQDLVLAVLHAPDDASLGGLIHVRAGAAPR